MAHNHSLPARLYALLTMSAYTTHLLVIVILLLQVPLIVMQYETPSWILLFSLAGLGQPLLFILGQHVLYSDWLWRLRHFPTLLLVAIGLAPTNTRAILQAVYGRHHPFIRTPKFGSQTDTPGYHLPFDWIVLSELLLALYALGGAVLAVYYQNTGPLLFLLTCAVGLGLVATLTLQEQVKARQTAKMAKPKQESKPQYKYFKY